MIYHYYKKYKIDLDKLYRFSDKAKKIEEYIKKSFFFEGLISKEEFFYTIILQSKNDSF